MSIILRQFVTKLYSRPSTLFAPAFRKAQSYLSPILFTLYTNDCTGIDTTPIIKSFDDSAMEDLSNSDSVCLVEAERFSNWCMDSSLDLNVKKTKEMLIDFRKAATVIPDHFNDGVKVETATEYKISRNSFRQQA